MKTNSKNMEYKNKMEYLQLDERGTESLDFKKIIFRQIDRIGMTGLKAEKLLNQNYEEIQLNPGTDRAIKILIALFHPYLYKLKDDKKTKEYISECFSKVEWEKESEKYWFEMLTEVMDIMKNRGMLLSRKIIERV